MGKYYLQNLPKSLKMYDKISTHISGLSSTDRAVLVRLKWLLGHHRHPCKVKSFDSGHDAVIYMY
jgi:hypothetical protein